VFNLGRTEPVALRTFVASLERALGTTAVVRDGGASKGEVDSTAADGSLSLAVLEFSPQTSLDQGLRKFAEWYRSSDRKPEFSHVAP
jgi:UDP-glucuronate 4-epimerase